VSDKKDKPTIEYTKIKHKGEEALVFNYGGDGELRIIAMTCVDYDSGVPCHNGEPDPLACAPGWTPTCEGGMTMCICDAPG